MEKRIKALLIEGKQKADIVDVIIKEFEEATASDIAVAIAGVVKAIEAEKAIADAESKEKAQEEAKAKAKMEAEAKSQEIADMVAKGVESALKEIDIPGKLEKGMATREDGQFNAKFIKDMYAYKDSESWQGNMCKMVRARINGEKEVARKISNEFFAKSMLYTEADKLDGKVLRGDATTGSYAVPDEFSDMVITVAQRGSNIFENSTKISMSSDKLNILGAGDVTFTDLTNQATEATNSEPTLTQTSLDIYDAAAYSLLSNDLAMDSNVNVVQILADSYGRGLAKYLKQRTTVGSTVTGDKQNGITFFSGIGSVTASTPSPSWEDLMETVSNVDETFLDGAVWEMNKNDWFQKLATLVDNDGKPLLVAPMGDWKNATLGGFPIKWNNQMPSTIDTGTAARTGGTERIILFGNPREVMMGLRGGFMFDVSPHPYFTYFQDCFRGKIRLDWTLINTTAYSRLILPAS